jgi:hypothetical protein
MGLHSSLGNVIATVGSSAAMVLLLAVTGTGCGGCNASQLQCDSEGNHCQVCDGYGCTPVDTGSGAGGFGATAATGTGGAGQGGAAQGGGGAGGAPACDPQITACPCDANDACADASQQCVNGLCVGGCEFSYECGAGKVCANGACVVGCDDETPCTAGYACDKGICQPDPQNPECSDQKPCLGSGEICQGGFCTTPCTTNAECGAGQICDGASGSCIPDPSPTKACGPNEACTGAGQQCGPDGYCHYPCTTTNECKLVDSRFEACDQGICKTQEEASPECTIDNPCPAGQDCISNHCL